MTCPSYELLSMGSGAIVLYDNKKTVLTAAHVCKQMKFELFLQKEKGDFYLKAIDRNDKEYIIKIIKYDTETDLCLLESTSGQFEAGYIKISPKKPEYGELTYNLAGPMGIIRGEMVPIFEGRFFGNSEGSAFYSTPAIGGSSGSPILNSKGELVGMIHSVHFRFHHVSLSATYEQLWNFLTIVRNHTLEFLN
jgi:S1-C subfamily serine protease